MPLHLILFAASNVSLAARPNNIAPNICSVRVVVCALVGFAEEVCWDMELRVRINGVRVAGILKPLSGDFFCVRKVVNNSVVRAVGALLWLKKRKKVCGI